jgi:transcriptional regulator with XRE-family HTH domain
MKNDAMIFWERVDNLVKSKGITLKQLCADYDLVYGTIMQNKARKILPSLLLTKGLSKALNTSIDYLVTGQEYQDPLFAKLQNDKELKATCSKISLCSHEHLNIINTMLSSWGYIVSEVTQNKGLA